MHLVHVRFHHIVNYMHLVLVVEIQFHFVVHRLVVHELVVHHIVDNVNHQLVVQVRYFVHLAVQQLVVQHLVVQHLVVLHLVVQHLVVQHLVVQQLVVQYPVVQVELEVEPFF